MNLKLAPTDISVNTLDDENLKVHSPIMAETKSNVLFLRVPPEMMEALDRLIAKRAKHAPNQDPPTRAKLVREALRGWLKTER